MKCYLKIEELQEENNRKTDVIIRLIQDKNEKEKEEKLPWWKRIFN